MKIGKTIEKMRKEKGISQEKLAEKLGITRQTLSNYENGITSPDLEQSNKLCEVLEMSLDELVGNNDTILSKVNNTERLVKKQNKNTKIILITLYAVIMIFLISITIYFSTKKDFTNIFLGEFNCYSKKDKSDLVNVSITGEATGENDIIDYFYITLCEHSYEEGGGCSLEEYFAGNDLNTAFNSLKTTKDTFLAGGYKCY